MIRFGLILPARMLRQLRSGNTRPFGGSVRAGALPALVHPGSGSVAVLGWTDTRAKDSQDLRIVHTAMSQRRVVGATLLDKRKVDPAVLAMAGGEGRSQVGVGSRDPRKLSGTQARTAGERQTRIEIGLFARLPIRVHQLVSTVS